MHKLKKCSKIDIPTIEIVGDRVILQKPMFKVLVSTLNNLTSTVNNLIDNQEELKTGIIENADTIKALANSIRNI